MYTPFKDEQRLNKEKTIRLVRTPNIFESCLEKVVMQILIIKNKREGNSKEHYRKKNFRCLFLKRKGCGENYIE